MRQVLAVVVLMTVTGCTEWVPGHAVTCEGDVTIISRTDRGDGTTILDCNSAKELVCTNPDCSGITNLTVQGTDLTSVNLAKLTSLASLAIYGNQALNSLNLPSLASVPDGMWCMDGCSGGGLIIEANSSLEALNLPALTMVGYLSIRDNAALRGVTLPSLTTATDLVNSGGGMGWWYVGLSVSGNAALQSLNAPALAEVHSLLVTDNTALAGLGLPALTKATALTITGNRAYSQCLADEILAHLDGFTGAPTFYGNDTAACMPSYSCGVDVWITNDAEMAAFAAVGCNEVSGNLHFKGADLTGVSLPGLTRVGGDLIVEGNPALTSLSFPALTTVAGWLQIRDSTALSGFSLPVLSTIGGYLFVWNNTALTSFSFPELTTVGGWMHVFLNSALTGFSFPALATTGSLDIENNTVLTSFSLPVVTTVGWLVIRDNPTLPECLAIAFKDHLVTAHGGFSGVCDIFYNDTTATCPP
jgi:hypothetical protein